MGGREMRQAGEVGPSGCRRRRRRRFAKKKRKRKKYNLDLHFFFNKLQPSLHSHDRLRFILRQQNRSYQFIYLARAALLLVLWWKETKLSRHPLIFLMLGFQFLAGIDCRLEFCCGASGEIEWEGTERGCEGRRLPVWSFEYSSERVWRVFWMSAMIDCFYGGLRCFHGTSLTLTMQRSRASQVISGGSIKLSVSGHLSRKRAPSRVFSLVNSILYRLHPWYQRTRNGRIWAHVRNNCKFLFANKFFPFIQLYQSRRRVVMSPATSQWVPSNEKSSTRQSIRPKALDGLDGLLTKLLMIYPTEHLVYIGVFFLKIIMVRSSQPLDADQDTLPDLTSTVIPLDTLHFLTIYVNLW